MYDVVDNGFSVFVMLVPHSGISRDVRPKSRRKLLSLTVGDPLCLYDTAYQVAYGLFTDGLFTKSL